MILEKLQLDNALAYTRQQISRLAGRPETDPRQLDALERQAQRLGRWLAWLPEHYYAVPIAPVAPAETYEPSAALRHFWIGFRHEKTHVPFNVVITNPLEDFNREAFRRTCAEIARRHEILRTVPVYDDGDGTVRLHVRPVAEMAPGLEVVDLSGESPRDKDRIMGEHFEAAQAHVFTYGEGPLLYFTVFKLDARRYHILFNVSHAVFDGWSRQVFENEFKVIYPAYCQGRPHPLADLPVQYKDYAAWEKQMQGTGLAAGFARYWHARSPGRYPARNLSTCLGNTPLAETSYRGALGRRIRPYLKSTDDRTIAAFYGVIAKAERTRANSYHFAVGGESFNRLNALCRERSVSPYHVLVAVLNALLYHATGEEDIVLGANVAIRDRPEVQKLVGFFVNTLLLRNRVDGRRSFHHLLTEVIETAALAAFYKNYTMSKVLDDLDIPFNAINTFFVNMLPSNAGAMLTNFSRRHHETGVRGYFDIDVTVQQYANGLECWCNYDLDVYAKDDITNLFDAFERLLDACLRHPDEALDALAAQTGLPAARPQAV